MTQPYKPPHHLAHLAKTVNAARTQLGWGVHDDGSVGVEHIISSNPFAGKTKVWGTAEINDDGDVQIVSKGPGNSHLAEALPHDLVQQITQFYEHEGLNVRNVSETNPSLDKSAEIEQGRKACPNCGEETNVHVIPNLNAAVCSKCRWSGPMDDLIESGEDPDPDRRMRDEDPDYTGTMEDYDDWADHHSMNKNASETFSIQGAPAGGNAPTSGIVVRPDRQSRQEIESMIGGLNPQAPHEVERQFNDKMNEGMGTSFPRSESPFINRGGSFVSEGMDDHFFETNWPKEADEDIPSVGTPGGPGDLRNFGPQGQPGFIVVSQYLTPDDNWIFTQKCKGIIAQAGGSTSHGAVVARAMGIPCIVDAPEADRIQPGDQVRMDPHSGRIDVNGGDSGFQLGEVRRAAHELVRFVWSKGAGVYSPVTTELTDELAALPYNREGEPDRSHYAMMEYLMMEDKYDFEDGTIGVIYSDGRAIYYEPISDQGDLENWLRSNFPQQVQSVIYQPTKGGIYQPGEAVHAKTLEEMHETAAPKCPECGSHTYGIVSMPQAPHGDGELECKNCHNVYKHHIYRNPKNAMQKGAPYPNDSYKNAPDHSPKGQKEWPEEVNAIYNACVREKHGESGEASEETKSSCAAIAWSTYKKNDGKPKDSDKNKKSKLVVREAADDDTGKTKGKWPAGTRVQVDHPNLKGKGTILEMTGTHGDLDEEQYEIQMDDGNHVSDIPESAFKKIRSAGFSQDDTLDDIYDRTAGRPDVGFEDWSCPTCGSQGRDSVYEDPEGGFECYNCGTPVDTNTSDVDSYSDNDGLHTIDADVPPAEMDYIEAASDSKPVNDTNGAPVKIGELYLMHSTQYKIPDLVRIVNVTPQQIEAHIDSDVRGMFPITIDPSEYSNLGYSFEPYQKTALVGEAMQALFAEVQAALNGHDASDQAQSIVNQLKAQFGDDPQTIQTLIPDADALSNFVNYYGDQTPNVHEPLEPVPDPVGDERNSHLAARRISVTPKRQQELINENMGAQARNFHKLKLEDTHYLSTYELIPQAHADPVDDHFLF